VLRTLKDLAKVALPTGVEPVFAELSRLIAAVNRVRGAQHGAR
jgi:hypothetical protein